MYATKKVTRKAKSRVEKNFRRLGLEVVRLPSADLIELAFCPTGPGGGIDPTCGKGGAKAQSEVDNFLNLQSDIPLPGHGSGKEGAARFAMPPANPDAKDTKGAYTEHDGSLTPERAALHQEIKDHAFRGVTPVNEPTAWVMGGGGGAGKSTVINMLPLPSNKVTINADEVKVQLPEFHTEGSKTGAAFVHEESSTVATEMQDEGSAGGYNTLLDGTGDSGIDKLSAKIGKMREAGQRVVGHYVTCRTETAVARAEERAKHPPYRSVPEKILREAHSDVSRTLPEAISRGLFDELDLWNTEVPRGEPPIRIASARGNKLVVHDQTLWDEFLLKGSERIPERLLK